MYEHASCSNRAPCLHDAAARHQTTPPCSSLPLPKWVPLQSPPTVLCCLLIQHWPARLARLQGQTAGKAETHPFCQLLGRAHHVLTTEGALGITPLGRHKDQRAAAAEAVCGLLERLRRGVLGPHVIQHPGDLQAHSRTTFGVPAPSAECTRNSIKLLQIAGLLADSAFCSNSLGCQQCFACCCPTHTAGVYTPAV